MYIKKEKKIFSSDLLVKVRQRIINHNSVQYNEWGQSNVYALFFLCVPLSFVYFLSLILHFKGMIDIFFIHGKRHV